MTTDETDTLCVSAKKAAGESIKEYYAAFGWVLNEQKDDEKYEDAEILYFSRPHFIAEKDDLQLLQVHPFHPKRTVFFVLIAERGVAAYR